MSASRAFEMEDVATLLGSFDSDDLVQLRDRALIGVMAFGLSHISAIVDLKVSDYSQQGRRAKLPIHGKGGVEAEIPVHHQLAEYLGIYR